MEIESIHEEEVEDDQPGSEHGEQETEVVEQAMLSMYAGCDRNDVSSMRFKGQIGKTQVCALLDNGSTHSFVSPIVVKKLKLPTVQTNPMVVRVANGEAMVTDSSCRELKFELQGYKFEKEVRLLAIQGYDLILGLDWLTNLGPKKIDWGKGTLEFNWKNQQVKLKVQEEGSELKMLEADWNIEKEIKKGNEVIIAQIFKIEQGERKRSWLNNNGRRYWMNLERYSKNQ